MYQRSEASPWLNSADFVALLSQIFNIIERCVQGFSIFVVSETCPAENEINFTRGAVNDCLGLAGSLLSPSWHISSLRNLFL